MRLEIIPLFRSTVLSTGACFVVAAAACGHREPPPADIVAAPTVPMPTTRGALPVPPIDPKTGRMQEANPAPAPDFVQSMEGDVQPARARLDELVRQADALDAAADANHDAADQAFEKALMEFRQYAGKHQAHEARMALDGLLKRAPGVSSGMLKVLANDLDHLQQLAEAGGQK